MKATSQVNAKAEMLIRKEAVIEIECCYDQSISDRRFSDTEVSSETTYVLSKVQRPTVVSKSVHGTLNLLIIFQAHLPAGCLNQPIFGSNLGAESTTPTSGCST